MNKKLKLFLSLLVSIAVTLCGCGKPAGKIDQSAATRPYDPNDTTIYIVDDFIPLADSAESAQLRTMAQSAMSLINAKRINAGLKELKWSIGLEQAALVRANEIKSLFSHTRPDGSAYWTANGNLVYGENLAMNYNTAEEVVAAWVASPGHNANLMDPNYGTCYPRRTLRTALPGT